MQELHSHPGLVVIKDHNSKFVSGSDRIANFLGWSSVEQMLGLTDFDLPCQAAQSADLFIKEDNIVFDTRKKMLTLDLQQYADNNWHLLLCERTLLPDRADSPPAILLNLIDVTGIAFFHAFVDYYNSDQKITGRNKAGSYIISDNYADLALTPRQSEILYHTLRGKTSKEISILLHISDRTVEGHIEMIKKSLIAKKNHK
jgi:DNA-binding CsgD family transcriptional regulator